MKCKYFRRRTQKISKLAGKQLTIQEDLCQLKLQDIQKRNEIYSILFKKGLERSLVGNNCPVARANKWSECPYFEPSE